MLDYKEAENKWIWIKTEEKTHATPRGDLWWLKWWQPTVWWTSRSARTIIWAYLGFPTTPTFLKTNVADYKESENIPGTKKQNLNLENANLKYQNRKPNICLCFLDKDAPILISVHLQDLFPFFSIFFCDPKYLSPATHIKYISPPIPSTFRINGNVFKRKKRKIKCGKDQVWAT